PTPTEPWLSPPLVVSTRNALRLREKTEPSARGTVIYPFLDRGKPFIPSARPALEENKPLTLFLYGQNLPQDLEIEASFEQGETKRTLEPTLLERREGEPETLVLALDSKDLGEGVLKVRVDGVEAVVEIVSSAVDLAPAIR
ncbi:MAG: hypothetical protein HC897_18515, partial [Thermoanaerobaculia bacterium]|nr:hypothetical protein [Thermoanaerobaculia bacterium]